MRAGCLVRADDVDAGAFGGAGGILRGCPAETRVEGRSANEGRDAGNFPVIQYPLGGREVHLRAEFRQVVYIVGYELLRTVEAGAAVVAEARGEVRADGGGVTV